MSSQEKLFPRKSAPEQSARMVEAIYGCKWSLTVYQLLASGINRPGQMVRSVEDLTTKVLNACLRKNMEFGIIEHIAYNEVPPRVEYVVTPFGAKFIRILDDLEKLQREIFMQTPIDSGNTGN
ncbi:MAG: helix-turn-helix domain-containing protein [Thiobacillus sp.]|nr:helix-turn-helix domain-containing protein [Thiobacillus sp.]